jgi:para-nitrobenzyl esterase
MLLRTGMTRIALLSVVLSTISVGCGDTSDAPDAATVAEPDSATGAACGADIPPADGIAITTSGAVRGQRQGDTWSYLGIPYAAPPVGPLRFAPPAAPACWEQIRPADTYGPRCPQLAGGAVIGDEDCLTLNVWVPAAASPPGGRPVMLWIHGGGNALGSASDPLYVADRLATAGDVVVVSIEYRLGPLGFLVHPALASGPADSVGNYGLLDQVAALQWVHDNAAAFTGDPDNVTIFGESAGGRDVCTLLATPSAAGLLHRAIVESGACKFLQDASAAASTGADLAAALGCDTAPDTAACLRAASPAALIEALPNDPGALGRSIYNPVVDGVVLPEQPEAAIRAGRHNPVPFIVGANAEETGRAAPPTMTQQQYETLIAASYGALADDVLAEYADISPPRAAYVAVTSDARFICPSHEIALSAAHGQSEPVYRYFFRHGPGLQGAVHGIELPYLFGTFSAITIAGGEPYQPTEVDLALSASMQSLWTSFARTGIPTAPSAPDWTATSVDASPALVLDTTLAIDPAAGTAHCDFWRPIYEAL